MTDSQGHSPQLSICMIVKDEAGILGRCLASVAPIADELVVVDTGSTDGTRQIARKAGALVVEEPWQDDFSHARNISIAHARGDWILWLDADDEIPAASYEKIAKLKQTPPACVYGFVVRSERFGNTGSDFIQARMFPRHPAIRFERRVHEQVLLSALRINMRMYEHRDVVILHHGYADAAQVRTKARRNVRLLRQEYTPENPDPVMMLEIGDSYKMLGEDDEAAAWYTAIISLSGAGRSYPEILSSAHFGMGSVLNKKGDYENAIAHLRHACTFIPDRPDALYGLAAAHDMRGEYEEAARLLEKIPGITPYARSVGIDYRQAALKAYLRLERVYARLGKDRDMCIHIDEALQRFGMRPEVHAMHGRVLFRMGRLLEALHAFEKSVRIMAKDNIDAYLGLCAIYLRAGKTQEAVRTLESMEPAFSHSPRYCAFRALMGDERFQDYCPPDATPDDVIAEKKLLQEVYGFFE